MRVWSLPLDAPLTLTLAADSRSDEFDPNNDQIWELIDSESTPVGLAIQSKFGLRAKNMNILPAFELDGKLRQALDDFEATPLVHTWLPSYISLDLLPFPELRVHAEYWVRGSSLLAGRFTFTNISEEALQAGLRISSILQPDEHGIPMSMTLENGVHILSGHTADLTPVVFLEGGARHEPGPFPTLGVQTLLASQENHSWIWVHSGAQSIHQGVERCRELLQSNWDADRARMLMKWSDLVNVETGDIEWDAALWAAQREAQNLFLQPNRRFKHAMPLQTRSVKHGSAATKGGTTWEPASPWDAFFTALQILPGSPNRVKGYIESLLRFQKGDGYIPSITDFNLPHDGWLYPPILAQLTLRVFMRTADKEFLRSNFRALLAFFECWFNRDHDRDGDGFPEWDHVNQAGFKSWPAFSPWYEWSKGLQISTAETIDMASLLILEGQALIALASEIGRSQPEEDIQKRVDLLRKRLDQAWSSGGGYKHEDYYLHESVAGRRLAVRRGSFKLEVNREFDPAARVQLQVEGHEEHARDIKVRIYSRGRRGPSRVEAYSFRDFNWFLEYGYLTSDKPSAEIEKIEIDGIDRKFRTEVSLGDYSRDDIMVLLPLAAGVPSTVRAEQIIEKQLKDSERFWRPFGIPSIPADDPDYTEATRRIAGSVDMLRNHWIGGGLLRYGYEAEAANLLKNLLHAIIKTLKVKQGFCSHYDAEGEQILHDHVSAPGLTPFALFLEVLGVQLITPRSLRIKPGNPLGRPVRITWKGLQIDCERDRTLVTFPDGGVVEVVGAEEQMVEQIEIS